VKCARKTRAEERRKPMEREVAGAPSRKLAAMSTPISLPLSLSLSLSLSLPLLPSMPPSMHRATTRYRPLHFSSSHASRRNEEKTDERCNERKKEKERERATVIRPSCARGKIKSLSDAPVVMSRMRATTKCTPRLTRSRLRTATFAAATGVKRDRVDLIRSAGPGRAIANCV